MGLNKIKINLSVVLFNTSLADIQNLLDSFEFVKSEYKLIIIDNSLENSREKYFSGRSNMQYIHNPSNPGFGASHNLAFKISLAESATYHFVINPDVYFKEDVISKMVEYISIDNEIGMMMPQILNLDGTIQNLPKLLPSPYSLILRKIKKPKFLYEDFISKYELRNIDKNLIYNAPILSGCFTVFRMSALEIVGFYDDRFFMYFEDWDLSRRIHSKFKTLYYPETSVYHGYESGANKNKFLFKTFVQSAVKYFNKWGWVFDSNRKIVNENTLEQFYEK